MTVMVFAHMFLTLANFALILAVFPFATMPFWLFAVVVAATLVVDILALAWTFGNLPDSVGDETVGAMWVVEQVVQLIVMVIVLSTITPLHSLLFLVFMLFFGKLRQGVIGKMFDTRF